MPYKFNDARRNKFPKAKYRVTNCSEYNESLRRRGDVTIWVSEDVRENWASPRRMTRGGQSRYSDIAIEICLTLRVVFRLPLRQTQGFMRSIARLMGMDLVVPDFSTLSRRGKGLRIAQNRRNASKPITLIVDSTGLKVRGDNCWHEEKHGTRKARKTWRKLHIGLDLETGDIAASELTTEHVGDETALPDLLADIDVSVARFLADGAYDGEGVADCLADRFGPGLEIIIPPPKNAVHGENAQRNRHITAIAEHGRMNWQAETGYN
ncbi:IS5 family transposase [Ruegeria hyattellae]|uniref:IS5 family transposase n=1 Tax=Ruegeria hyattellae TaxID=3233337 RepID=UPI00355C3683